jgi:hypothetical protein
MNPTELVERVIELGHERLPEALELLHPDAIWVLHDERPPLRGHEEIARFVAEELERLRPDVPEPVTSSLTQRGNTVLVYGQLRIPHTGGRRFVEMQQIAWVYEVEGDKVSRSDALPHMGGGQAGGRDRARHAAHPPLQPVAATSVRAGVAAASRPPAAPGPRCRR